MRCWIVPSSLFVPGRIMSPIRLMKEKEAAETRKKKLEIELAALPNRIQQIEKEISELGEEYKPFKPMENNATPHI